MCLNIGTPKNINFPFQTNGKLMALSVPILKHFRVLLCPYAPVICNHAPTPPLTTIRNSRDFDLKSNKPRICKTLLFDSTHPPAVLYSSSAAIFLPIKKKNNHGICPACSRSGGLWLQMTCASELQIRGVMRIIQR